MLASRSGTGVSAFFAGNDDDDDDDAAAARVFSFGLASSSPESDAPGDAASSSSAEGPSRVPSFSVSANASAAYSSWSICAGDPIGFADRFWWWW